MGFITVGGVSPTFFALDAANRIAIGVKLYYHAKVGSFRDSIQVLRESIRVSVFVLEFRLFVCKICNREYLYEEMNIIFVCIMIDTDLGKRNSTN